MIVIGLDLSLTSTGMARFDTQGLTDGHPSVYPPRLTMLGNVKTKGKKTDTLADRMMRLDDIANKVQNFVNEYDWPDLAVIESPSFGSVGGSAHDRSGLWWIVARNLYLDGIPVAMVAPTTRAKYATGDGRAGKDVVMAHVIERYVNEGTPRIVNDDQADATVLAAMGCRWLGEPAETLELPPANLDAMGGAKWPTM